MTIIDPHSRLSGLMKRCQQNKRRKALSTTDTLDDTWHKVITLASKIYEHQYYRGRYPMFSYACDIAERVAGWGLSGTTVLSALLTPALYQRVLHPKQIDFENESPKIQSVATNFMNLLGKGEQSDFPMLRGDWYRPSSWVVEELRAVLILVAVVQTELERWSQIPSEQLRVLLPRIERIYLPTLEQLGLWKLRGELRDQYYRAKMPQLYNRTEQWGEKMEQTRAPTNITLIQKIKEALSHFGIPLQVQNAPCSAMGVRVEMARRDPSAVLHKSELHYPFALQDPENLPFQHVARTLFYIHITTDTVAEMYLALGAVHSLSTHVVGEFQDFFSNPKNNGYAGLKTAINYNAEIYGISIITKNLLRLAEEGVLLDEVYQHWVKEGEPYQPRKSLMLGDRSWTSPEQRVLEQFVKRMLTQQADTLTILTPRNESIIISNTATVLDFAFKIHYEVGIQTVGAKVNDESVPLWTVLNHHDRVEIITDRNSSGPQEAWLEWGKLAYTRRKIRAELNRRPSNRGRTILESALSTLNLGFNNVQIALDALLIERQITNTKLFEDIADGTSSAQLVAEHLASWKPAKSQRYYTIRLAAEEEAKLPGWSLEQMIWTQCSNNIHPHQPVVAYQTAAGLELHLADCFEVRDPQRVFRLEWYTETLVTKNTQFRLHCRPKKGLTHEVTGIIQEIGLRILWIEGRLQGTMDIIECTVEYESDLQLYMLFRTLHTCLIPTPQIYHNFALVDRQRLDALEDDLPPFKRIPNTFTLFPAGKYRKHFSGRLADLHLLKEKVIKDGQSIVLNGAYRIGKTSLLSYWSELKEVRAEVSPVYVNLEGCGVMEPQTYLEHILDAIEEKISPTFQKPQEQVTPLSMARRVRRLVETHDKPIVVILDEVALLSIAEETYSQTYQKHYGLFPILRDWIQRSGMQFILCTSDNIYDWLNKHADIENVLLTYHLSCMSSEDIRYIVQDKPELKQNIVYEPEALKIALRKIGGSPFYAQLFGNQLVNTLNERQVNIVSEAMVREVLKLIIQGDKKGARFAVYFRDEQKIRLGILAYLCHHKQSGGVPLADIWTSWEQQNLPIPSVTVREDAIQALQQIGKIKPVKGSDDCYQISFPLISQWWQGLSPEERGEQIPWLKYSIYTREYYRDIHESTKPDIGTTTPY